MPVAAKRRAGRPCRRDSQDQADAGARCTGASRSTSTPTADARASSSRPIRSSRCRWPRSRTCASCSSARSAPCSASRRRCASSSAASFRRLQRSTVQRGLGGFGLATSRSTTPRRSPMTATTSSYETDDVPHPGSTTRRLSRRPAAPTAASADAAERSHETAHGVARRRDRRRAARRVSETGGLAADDASRIRLARARIE